MEWIITVKNPESEEYRCLAWSNKNGWCDDEFDVFTDEEKHAYRLPLGGEWRSFIISTDENGKQTKWWGAFP